MSALQPNTTLCNGKYKILKTLGQGGFGITYLAEMKVGGNFTPKVTVKEFFIRDEHYRDTDGMTVCCTKNAQKRTDIERWKKKFKRETELLKAVNDERVVKVIELFEENATVYYSMEYIDGCNMSQHVPKNGLSEYESVSLITKVANALKVLHNKKMLHLDLNPKNIMVRSNGEVVLIDFGLSKLYDENQQPINSSVSVGAQFPGFAPIEQEDFDGKFTPTLDIYALGANFYKMFTGENPPKASEILDKGFSSLKAKLTAHNVSDSLIAVVEKSLQPIKMNRYQTVDDFIKALESKSENVIDTIDDTQKTLEKLLNDLIQNKEYKRAYNLCLDYIDSGKCKDYALKRSSEITTLLRKQTNSRNITQVILVIIATILATIIGIATQLI